MINEKSVLEINVLCCKIYAKNNISNTYFTLVTLVLFLEDFNRPSTLGSNCPGDAQARSFLGA